MSEFGRGLTYNLGLFLAHAERINEYRRLKSTNPKSTNPYSLWFYGAADHLFELEIPKNLSKLLQGRLAKFQARCLDLRLPLDKQKEATETDYKWAIQEAKDLLRFIDNNMGVKTEKSDWE